MRELTTTEAGKSLGMTDQAVRDHIHAGRLDARRIGMRRQFMISEQELRRFAQEYNYDLNLPNDEGDNGG